MTRAYDERDKQYSKYNLLLPRELEVLVQILFSLGQDEKAEVEARRALANPSLDPDLVTLVEVYGTLMERRQLPVFPVLAVKAGIFLRDWLEGMVELKQMDGNDASPARVVDLFDRIRWLAHESKLKLRDVHSVKDLFAAKKLSLKVTTPTFSEGGLLPQHSIRRWTVALENDVETDYADSVVESRASSVETEPSEFDREPEEEKAMEPISESQPAADVPDPTPRSKMPTVPVPAELSRAFDARPAAVEPPLCQSVHLDIPSAIPSFPYRRPTSTQRDSMYRTPQPVPAPPQIKQQQQSWRQPSYLSPQTNAAALHHGHLPSQPGVDLGTLVQATVIEAYREWAALARQAITKRRNMRGV